MLAFQVRFNIRPEACAEFELATQKFRQQVRKAHPSQRLECWRDPQNPGQYLFFEVYAGVDLLKDHINSVYFYLWKLSCEQTYHSHPIASSFLPLICYQPARAMPYLYHSTLNLQAGSVQTVVDACDRLHENAKSNDTARIELFQQNKFPTRLFLYTAVSSIANAEQLAESAVYDGWKSTVQMHSTELVWLTHFYETLP